jgi:hypothetical protein
MRPRMFTTRHSIQREAGRRKPSVPRKAPAGKRAPSPLTFVVAEQDRQAQFVKGRSLPLQHWEGR